MYIITLLLGAILFFPNYASALEERLQSEKTFKPLNVFDNLKKSTKASKPLAFFGIILCVGAVVLYITSSTLPPLSNPDRIKFAAAFLLLWVALISGHLQALALSTEKPPVKFSMNILFTSTGSAWRSGLQKSLKEMSCIIALAFFIFAISKAASWFGF